MFCLLSIADHGEGEAEFCTKTQLQDAQGNPIPAGGAKRVGEPIAERKRWRMVT